MHGEEESSEEAVEETNGQSGVKDDRGQATREVDAAQKPIDRTTTRPGRKVHEVTTRIEAEIKTDRPVKIESAKIRQVADAGDVGHSDIPMSPPNVDAGVDEGSDIPVSLYEELASEPSFMTFMAMMEDVIVTTESNKRMLAGIQAAITEQGKSIEENSADSRRLAERIDRIERWITKKERETALQQAKAQQIARDAGMIPSNETSIARGLA